jgi:hypothetical protein
MMNLSSMDRKILKLGKWNFNINSASFYFKEEDNSEGLFYVQKN